MLQNLKEKILLKFKFKLFINIHRLYIIVYVLLIIHSTNYWKWFVGPSVFLIIEIFVACYQTKSKVLGFTYIKEVNLLPSGVTQLIIKRPKNFKFHAGDYIRIKVPVISLTEYHPFTISSAPETEGNSIQLS